MEQEPDWADGDAEIAALLSFAPVVRKIVRGDGWGPAEQRGFIACLARSGDVTAAALAVERSANGAKLLRKEDVAGEFRAAWDRALALHRTRRRASEALRKRAHAARARGEQVLLASEMAEADEAEKLELLREIFKRYVTKLHHERTARLDGRIVEADFYVRQLTHIELILDVGGRTAELLEAMNWDGLHLLQVSATPGSAYFEKLRRRYWQEKGEADRPPPAPLGDHDERFSTGRDIWDPERDGDRARWERAQTEKRRLAAEAQKEWEARAKREAGLDEAGDPDDAGGNAGP